MSRGQHDLHRLTWWMALGPGWDHLIHLSYPNPQQSTWRLTTKLPLILHFGFHSPFIWIYSNISSTVHYIVVFVFVFFPPYVTSTTALRWPAEKKKQNKALLTFTFIYMKCTPGIWPGLLLSPQSPACISLFP